MHTKSTLTIQELAERLGVSPMTIYRLRKDEQLPAPIPTSRRFVRWRRSEIELWFELDCPNAKEFKKLKADRRRFARS